MCFVKVILITYLLLQSVSAILTLVRQKSWIIYQGKTLPRKHHSWCIYCHGHSTVTYHTLSIYCGRFLLLTTHLWCMYCARLTVVTYHILHMFYGRMTSLFQLSWCMRLIHVYRYSWCIYCKRLVSITQHSTWVYCTRCSLVTKHSWSMCFWMFMTLVQHLWCRYYGVLIYSQNVGHLRSLEHGFLRMEWAWISRIYWLVRTSQPQNIPPKIYPVFKTFRDKGWAETRNGQT